MNGRAFSHKFSLVELLVVVAIIAILAGMMLPVLNKARETSQKTYCSGNQKQAMLGLMQYSSDANGYLLGAQGQFLTSNKDPWAYVLKTLGYTPSYKMFECPKQPNRMPLTNWGLYSYGMYEANTTSWNGNKTDYYKSRVEETGDFSYFHKPDSSSNWSIFILPWRMKKTSTLLLISDSIRNETSKPESVGRGSYRFYPANDGYPYLYIFMAHGDRESVQAFADGHVQSRSKGELLLEKLVIKYRSDIL